VKISKCVIEIITQEIFIRGRCLLVGEFYTRIYYTSLMPVVEVFLILHIIPLSIPVL